MLMHDLDFEGAKEDLSERVILVESDRLEDSHKYQLERFRDTLGLLLKKYKEGPIAVKTHLPWVMLPKQIQEFKKRPKIIYLVRNPKSLVCSLVHWKNLMHGKVEPVEGVADRFMDGTAIPRIRIPTHGLTRDYKRRAFEKLVCNSASIQSTRRIADFHALC
ncbi:unnamed protein product [Acanthoscelides obtectus]|uniref:Sulfotransferase domain-containing protein n=2 Tax=Acanthoscelides obtectus TaxID=200917 RepID=A0A9P0KFK0_ACAOB|nr:unnamed protein product [Acanthoscelides obtectus]CAK1680382.1 hypothetical protein AOBTE_LOCUS32611 [Acanthoscelides obtectus]